MISACKDHRDPKVTEEVPDLLGYRDQLDQVDQLVTLGHLDNPVTEDQQALKVSQILCH